MLTTYLDLHRTNLWGEAGNATARIAVLSIEEYAHPDPTHPRFFRLRSGQRAVGVRLLLWRDRAQRDAGRSDGVLPVRLRLPHPAAGLGHA